MNFGSQQQMLQYPRLATMGSPESERTAEGRGPRMEFWSSVAGDPQTAGDTRGNKSPSHCPPILQFPAGDSQGWEPDGKFIRVSLLGWELVEKGAE